MKFVRRDVRDKFYTSRKYLRDKSTKDIGLTRVAEHKIHICESLTQHNRKLFNLCLEKKKRLNYKYIWTSVGRTLMRKDKSSPVISISEMKGLDKIL